MSPKEAKEIFGDPVYTYTREQAIEDGTFTDVSETAKEAGFKIPVVTTQGVEDLCDPSETAQAYGQSREGRLWDVLTMAMHAVRTVKRIKRILPFKVIVREGKAAVKTVELWLSFEDDANGKTAATILFPSEY